MAKIIKNKRLKMDDGFRPELIYDAVLDGKLEIPSIDREDDIIVPEYLVPYSEIEHCDKINKFGCFYEKDSNFIETVIDPTSPEVLGKIRMCRGITTPDYTVDINAPLCVQVMQIYRSRAIGAFFQSQGIYTVLNIRFGDRRTFTTEVFLEPIAFMGAPKESIVSIGTYGVVKNRATREIFREGLIAMLEYLKPKVVLVYGSMPDGSIVVLRIETSSSGSPAVSISIGDNLSIKVKNQKIHFRKEKK